MCPNDFERIATPLEVVPFIRSLCQVGGIYGRDINGKTETVGFRAMTALKRDGSALISGVTRICAERYWVSTHT